MELHIEGPFDEQIMSLVKLVLCGEILCDGEWMGELSEMLVRLWHILTQDDDVGTDTFISSVIEFELTKILDEYAESSALFVLSSSLITGVSV